MFTKRAFLMKFYCHWLKTVIVSIFTCYNAKSKSTFELFGRMQTVAFRYVFLQWELILLRDLEKFLF